MDNKTHHCVESVPNLPYPVLGAMEGLIDDKYPIICGGVNLVQGISSQSVFIETPARISNYDIFDSWELAAWS